MSHSKKYCPQWHERGELIESTLWSSYRYCEKCDKIYVPYYKELIIEDLYCMSFNYPDERFQEMKKLWKIIEARDKVTKEQLIELWLLE